MKHDAMNPRRERVARKDDGIVTVRLLAATWRQKLLTVAQIRWKGAVIHQPEVMFPFQQKHAVKTLCVSSSGSPAGLQRMCKALVGATSNKGVAPARGARCDCSPGWRPLPEGRVHRESVLVDSIQLQYSAATYTYKYGWKYGALWTCAERSVFPAVFMSQFHGGLYRGVPLLVNLFVPCKGTLAIGLYRNQRNSFGSTSADNVQMLVAFPIPCRSLSELGCFYRNVPHMK